MDTKIEDVKVDGWGVEKQPENETLEHVLMYVVRDLEKTQALLNSMYVASAKESNVPAESVVEPEGIENIATYLNNKSSMLYHSVGLLRERVGRI